MARPRKNDPEALKRVVARFRRSQDWRRNEGYDDLWERMIDLYRGKQYKSQSKEDRALVNMAFATKNVIAPSVSINNPKFAVNARRPDSAPQAIIAEQVLNYLWRVGKYQDEFRLAVDDFLEVGHGWMKIGYKATKPKKVIEVGDLDDGTDDAEGVQDRDETVVGNVESELRTFGPDSDRPFAERISIFDVFVDPDARHPKEMGWIAQRIKRPATDVMVDERYDAKIRTKVNTSSALNQRFGDDNKIQGQPDRTSDVSYVDVVEFYDLRKGTVCTFCVDVTDGFLIPPQPMPYGFGQPFVMLRNYEVVDHFYPMGDLESIEALQHELNATRSQMMNHRKRYQRKVLYDVEAFDQKGIAALQDDKDNVLVPVETSSAQVDITKVVAPMPQVGTPPDFYNQSDLIENDINNVSGVSDYMRGAQAEIRRTATEAAMIQDAMNARAADKLARIESVLSEIGGRLVQLMQQYMTGESVIRIVGPNSAPMWVTFDVDYIQGEFDFEVEGGSTQPRNESFRRQSALQLVDALAPFIGQGIVNPQAVARHVLQFGFDVKDPDSFLMQQAPMAPGAPGQGGAPTDDPMAQLPPEVGQVTQEQAIEQSPLDDIPPELLNQLVGQVNLPLD